MRRSTLALLLVLLLALVALPACDDDGGEGSGTDTTATDTAGGDTSGTDTAGGDTSGGDTTGGDTDGGGDTTTTDTSDDDTGGTDTTSDTGDDTTAGDTTPDDTDDTTGDTTGDTTDMVEPPVCDHDGFVSVAQDAGEFQGVFFYVAQDTLESPVSTLNFELVTAAGGATAAGTYTLTDDDYSTCANCVLIYQNCDADLVACEKTFLATSGTLEIAEFGQPGESFSGTLTDAVLVEVTIDETTFVSTVVEGGESWCIDDYAFFTTVQ